VWRFCLNVEIIFGWGPFNLSVDIPRRYHLNVEIYLGAEIPLNVEITFGGGIKILYGDFI
jgi:hypothetical protein